MLAVLWVPGLRLLTMCWELRKRIAQLANVIRKHGRDSPYGDNDDGQQPRPDLASISSRFLFCVRNEALFLFWEGGR